VTVDALKFAPRPPPQCLTTIPADTRFSLALKLVNEDYRRAVVDKQDVHHYGGKLKYVQIPSGASCLPV
jgi:hypothetical protein